MMPISHILKVQRKFLANPEIEALFSAQVFHEKNGWKSFVIGDKYMDVFCKMSFEMQRNRKNYYRIEHIERPETLDEDFVVYYDVYYTSI